MSLWGNLVDPPVSGAGFFGSASSSLVSDTLAKWKIDGIGRLMYSGFMKLRPDKVILETLYQQHTDEEIAKHFKVSPATVRRWRAQLGILSKPRGPRSDNARVDFWTDSQIAQLVVECFSYAEMLTKMGRPFSGSSHSWLRERIRDIGSDISHFGKRRKLLGSKGNILYSLETLMARRVQLTQSIKRRILATGRIPNICEICGQLPEWQGRPLVLQLDHVDGDNLNHSWANLRILCPHCHSQTDTFAGRNRHKMLGPK